MDRPEAFAEKSIELMLKIKKIENEKLNDSNEVLFNALKEKATFPTININKIVSIIQRIINLHHMNMFLIMIRQRRTA